MKTITNINFVPFNSKGNNIVDFPKKIRKYNRKNKNYMVIIKPKKLIGVIKGKNKEDVASSSDWLDMREVFINTINTGSINNLFDIIEIPSKFKQKDFMNNRIWGEVLKSVFRKAGIK